MYQTKTWASGIWRCNDDSGLALMSTSTALAGGRLVLIAVANCSCSWAVDDGRGFLSKLSSSRPPAVLQCLFQSNCFDKFQMLCTTFTPFKLLQKTFTPFMLAVGRFCFRVMSCVCSVWKPEKWPFLGIKQSTSGRQCTGKYATVKTGWPAPVATVSMPAVARETETARGRARQLQALIGTAFLKLAYKLSRLIW